MSPPRTPGLGVGKPFRPRQLALKPASKFQKIVPSAQPQDHRVVEVVDLFFHSAPVAASDPMVATCTPGDDFALVEAEAKEAVRAAPTTAAASAGEFDANGSAAPAAATTCTI